MKPFVIGLAGEAGSGKDTIGNFLQKNYYFQKTAFAAPLKSCIKELFLMTDEQLENRTLKEKTDDRYGLSPRQIMQLFGTEFVRKMIHVNFWINRMEEFLNSSEHSRFVITDIRFPNEAELVRKYGYVIHIERPNNPIRTNNSNHVSEQKLVKHPEDYIIINNENELHETMRAANSFVNNFCGDIFKKTKESPIKESSKSRSIRIGLTEEIKIGEK